MADINDILNLINQLGDWFCIILGVIYLAFLITLIWKFSGKCEFDKTALIVLILQMIAFITLIIRSILSFFEWEEMQKYQIVISVLSQGFMLAGLFVLVFEMNRVRLLVSSASPDTFKRDDKSNNITKWVVLSLHFMKTTLLAVINFSVYTEIPEEY